MYIYIPCISSILFISKPKYRNFLIRDRIKKRKDDAFGKAMLLILVHVDDGTPVCRDFTEMKTFSQIDEI